MTKKLWIFCLLGALIGLIGCREPKVRVYSEVIPGNADAVIAVKMNRVWRKSGMTEKWGDWFSRQENIKRLQLLVKDCNASGLDLDENIYLFVAGDGEQQEGMVARVIDKAMLKENLEAAAAAGTAEILSERGGYSRAVIGEKIICMFDTNVLLCINIGTTRETAFQYAEELLKRPGGDSFEETEKFRQLNAADKDIAVWIAGNLIFESQSLLMIANGINPADIHVLGTMNFENGKIGISCRMQSDVPAVQEWLARITKMKNHFLDFFPASSICYWGNAIDGKQVAAQLEKAGFGDKTVSPQDRTEALKIISAFNGDISWGITEFSPLGIPAVLAYAQVENNYPAKALASAVQVYGGGLLDIRNTGEGKYEAYMKMFDMSVWFGVEKGVFYLTNDREMYRNIGKEVLQPLGKLEWVAGLKKADTGFLLDIEKFLQSPAVRMGIYRIYGYFSPRNEAVFHFLSAFSYLEIVGIKDSVYLNLYMKEKERNSLKVLLDEVEN